MIWRQEPGGRRGRGQCSGPALLFTFPPSSALQFGGWVAGGRLPVGVLPFSGEPDPPSARWAYGGQAQFAGEELSAQSDPIWVVGQFQQIFFADPE